MAGVGTTHHVKVGNDYLLIRQGSYRKRAAPQFGARFTTGDPDYNNLSFWQHWAQTCWVGGMGADTWSDDAMFDEGVGVDVSTHEVAILARDLDRGAGTNWDLSANVVPREFVVFNGKLYVLDQGDAATTRLHRYNPQPTDSWSTIHTFTASVRGVCGFSGKLFFGDGGNAISYMNPDETFATNFAKPSGRTEVPYCMKVFAGKMYVPFGPHIWRMKSNETWDGSTEFFNAVGVDYIVAMELHQGFLYMASHNGHILRTDGNVTTDIWQWDGGVTPTSLRSYDGKLFVATNELREDGSATEGVLYQFTGSAVTELKRWGRISRHCPIGKMRVGRRHLFYGAGGLLGSSEAGFGIAVYDAVEDSHVVFASNRDGTTYAAGTNGVNHIVDDVIEFGGRLFCAVRGHGIFQTPLSFRDASRYLATYDTTTARGSVDSLNGGWFTSSDFDAGTPGLNKLWRKIVVHVDVPTSATAAVIDISRDGGISWTKIGSITGDGITTRRATSFYLGNVIGPRIKWRVTLRTTDRTRTPALRGVIVSYLPLPDPNWIWEMSIVAAQEVELLDGSKVTQDVAGIMSRLENAFRAQTPLTFVDVDGTQWASTMPGVLIYDITKDLRYIGPSADGPLEGDIRLVLIEAIENTQ